MSVDGKTPIRVLIIEDSEDDVFLVCRELERNGYQVSHQRVDSAAGLEQALDGRVWDVAIGDYTMPGFSGVEALAMIRRLGYDMPFIFVSGTMGEDTAVEAMQCGAQDYVIKGNLKRLGPAVRREVQDAAIKRDYFRVEAEHRASEFRLRQILTMAVDAIIVIDAQRRIDVFNHGAERIFGWEAGEVAGRDLDLLLAPGAAEVLPVPPQPGPGIADGQGGYQEITAQRRNGARFPAEASVSAWQLNDEPRYTLILRDITERKQAESELRLLESVYLLAAQSDSLHAALEITLQRVCNVIQWDLGQAWLPDGNGDCLECSSAWYQRQDGDDALRGASLGFRFARGEGLPGRAWQSGEVEWMRELEDVESFPRSPHARKSGYRSGVAVPARAGDQVIAILEFFTRQPRVGEDRMRKLLSLVAGQLGTVIQRKRMEDRLHYLAHHDALTGLPNRVLVRDRLNQGILEADRHGRLLGVAFLDLDRFKTINDTLGHAAGDILLSAVAERLRNVVRNDDTVARLGGDEFTLILTDMARAEDAAHVAQKILGCFTEPFHIAGYDFTIGMSMGMTIYPLDDSDVDGLLRNADIAMYRAKEQGGNTCQFHTAEMTTRVRQRLELERDLHRALDQGQFYLHYQPIMDLATGAFVSAEALIRWHHPRRGEVSPAEFIPLAEETGIIAEIGEWVLRESVACFQRWRAAGLPLENIAVNVSARQFHGRDFAGLVRRVTAESGFDPACLVLEITESLLIDNAAVVSALRELNDMGTQISIDDFGTGYSSLGYLRRFPVDHVKIDRSFVSDLPLSNDATVVVLAIIGMAHALGQRTIAEGVETGAQLEFLRAHGCDLAQGFHLARPLPAEAYARFPQGRVSKLPWS